nr:hypothetical protein BdHM001_02920 [Bdellovibrio sp. HM001]
MKENLVLNLVPLRLNKSSIEVYFSEDTENDCSQVRGSKLRDLEGFPFEVEPNKSYSWSLQAFENSEPFQLKFNAFFETPTVRFIEGELLQYLRSKEFICGNGHIGEIEVLEPNGQEDGLARYKKFSLAIHPPNKRIFGQKTGWYLSINYRGLAYLTSDITALSAQAQSSIKKIADGPVLQRWHRDHAAPAQAKYYLSREGRFEIGVTPRRVENKYLNAFKEIERFYHEMMFAKKISDGFSVLESGLLRVPDSQIQYTQSGSNLLVFAEEQTHFSTYYGLKEFGPYQVPPREHRFIFVFHENDKDLANQLFSYLNKGFKSYPGLSRFVGVQVKIDTQRSIRFSSELPSGEITEKLANMTLEPNITYCALYISRITKDEKDPAKNSEYYKIKKALLDKNISSQVIFKENILKPSFNYFLPNISIAILAKIGGIPWRLKAPAKDDLVIGFGAFKGKDRRYLGTTFCFRNDGTFVGFDSAHEPDVEHLGTFFEQAIKNYLDNFDSVKRVVIHFYKKINDREERALNQTLERLNIKVPYIVVNVVDGDNHDIIFFDQDYAGKMPTSGVCVKLDNRTFLLANNTRYKNNSAGNIDDYPFPVKITFSAKDLNLVESDIREVIDQIYQFSRMYWVSVKQKGKPVTVIYSEKIARMNSFMETLAVPNTEVAKKSLWFL